MGILTWFISFPLVGAISQLADLIVYFIFGIVKYEQVAVRYLKMTLQSPPMLVIALILIILAAPVIEEFFYSGGFCKVGLKND